MVACNNSTKKQPQSLFSIFRNRTYSRNSKVTDQLKANECGISWNDYAIKACNIYQLLQKQCKAMVMTMPGNEML